jgi:hypothetical protein
VPLQLATDRNEHTDDPSRFTGEIVGVEVTPSGLDALVETTPIGDKLLTENPKCGVSARMEEGLSHADRRAYPRALKHVLLALDPVVTGMSKWALALSRDDDAGVAVVDLTAAV